MLKRVAMLFLGSAAVYALIRWYYYEEIIETEGTIHLQSEHEHFHFHVDLPSHLEVQPGDTLEILSLPDLPEGRTNGEVTYNSPVRLHKASALQRYLIKNTSLIEVNEIVEHP